MEPKTARRLETPKTASQSGVSRAYCNADSIILTLNGEQHVRDVRAGDRVITRDTGTAIIRSVSIKRVRRDAVRIKAGSLGHTRPPDDAIIPAETQVLLRDWRAKALFGREQALAPAHRLCDGSFIELMPYYSMDIVTLVFDKSHILYVAGLEIAAQPQIG